MCGICSVVVCCNIVNFFAYLAYLMVSMICHMSKERTSCDEITQSLQSDKLAAKSQAEVEGSSVGDELEVANTGETTHEGSTQCSLPVTLLKKIGYKCISGIPRIPIVQFINSIFYGFSAPVPVHPCKLFSDTVFHPITNGIASRLW